MSAAARKQEAPLLSPGELDALQAGLRPQACALIAAFAAMPRMSEDEACACLHAAGFKSDRFSHLLYETRRHLRAKGWYIFRVSPRTGRGVFELAPDAAPPVMAREIPSPGALHAKPAPVAKASPPVARRIIAGRRQLTIPAAPGGCCQFIVVRDGKPVPCGNASKGTYCPEHKAVSAGVPYREGLY